MKTIKELEEIREAKKKELKYRVISDSKEFKIAVSMSDNCDINAKARETFFALIEETEKICPDSAIVVQEGDSGLAGYEPVVEVFSKGKEKITYVCVNPEKAKEIVDKHISGGTAITEYTYGYAVKEK